MYFHFGQILNKINFFDIHYRKNHGERLKIKKDKITCCDLTRFFSKFRAHKNNPLKSSFSCSCKFRRNLHLCAHQKIRQMTAVHYDD